MTGTLVKIHSFFFFYVSGDYLLAAEGAKNRVDDTTYETECEFGRGKRRKRQTRFPESDDEAYEERPKQVVNQPRKKSRKVQEKSMPIPSPPPLVPLNSDKVVASPSRKNTFKITVTKHINAAEKKPDQLAKSKKKQTVKTTADLIDELAEQKVDDVIPYEVAKGYKTPLKDDSPTTTISVLSSGKKSSILSPFSPSRQLRRSSPISIHKDSVSKDLFNTKCKCVLSKFVV